MQARSGPQSFNKVGPKGPSRGKRARVCPVGAILASLRGGGGSLPPIIGACANPHIRSDHMLFLFDSAATKPPELM